MNINKTKHWNRTIKYTDFLIISVTLSIVFSIIVLYNTKHLVHSTKYGFVQQQVSSDGGILIRNSAHEWRYNNNINKKGKDNAVLVLPPRARGGGLSACLLVKDENNNLPEWIAYHYHILPLRYLVVAVDPNSMTSPIEILQRWNNTIMGMHIIVWDDDWFLPRGKRGKLAWNDTKKFVLIHRHRQRYFYQKCIQHLHERNSTWTLFIDADEYLTINPITNYDSIDLFRKNDGDSYQSIPVNQRQYINIRNKFGIKPMTQQNTAAIFNEKLNARTRLPSTIHQTTIAQFIQNERLNQPWSSNSCIVFPRVTFGNAEEPNQTLLYENIPKKINPLKLNTLRFFRYDYKGTKDAAMSPGKSFVDISRLSKYTLTRNMTLCMHAIVKECGIGSNAVHVMLEESILKVNHYSMPKEIFFAKSDKKRNQQIYEQRAQFNGSVSYFMQPWLESFVKEVGLVKAMDLLNGVGEIGKWKHPDDNSNLVPS